MDGELGFAGMPALREWPAERLLVHLVPSAFVVLDAIPASAAAQAPHARP